MVQASEIRDEDTLKAWLEGRPERTRQRDAVTIAYRAAMRVLPFYICVLGERWAQERKLLALPVLAACLTSGVWIENQSAEVDAAATRATSASNPVVGATSAATVASTANARAAFAASVAVSIAASISAPSSASAAASIVDIVASAVASASYLNGIRVDAYQLSQGISPYHAALWNTSDPIERPISADGKAPAFTSPEAFQIAWQKARAWLSTNPGHEFWIRWYEAALEGRPLTGDWESHDKLLTDIALIPDEDWAKGAEHVAGLIEDIEERYRLLLETRRLKAELFPLVAQSGTPSLGHNNPPEPLSDTVAFQRITLIWDTLDDTEEELAKPRPDRQRLRRLAQILLDASTEIAKYCGKLADKAMQKAAEELGSSTVKWAIRLGVGTFGAKMLGLDEAVRTLAEALARYAGG